MNLDGGDIVYAALPDYPSSLETPNDPLRMFEMNNRTYIAQSGLVGEDGIDTGNRARYSSDSSRYELGDQDSMDVVLNYQNDSGVQVKIFNIRENYL
ncbi:MAG: membrane protein insertase YidC [Reinekea sp.]